MNGLVRQLTILQTLAFLYLYILKNGVCLSVCLFVCLFGFGGQSTGWISSKFGMGHLLDPVDNLEIFFWLDAPRGAIIWKNSKIQTSPYGQKEGRDPFAVPFAHFLIFFLKWIYFLMGLMGRAELDQSTGWPSTGAEQLAPS